MEQILVSVVSLRFVSIGREWTIVSILSVSDASRDVFVLAGTSKKMTG